ncbi:hypothetical protein JTE90_017590, partial [Oedothorax gibbosus]
VLPDNEHFRLTFFIEKQTHYIRTLISMVETMQKNPRSPLLPFPYNPNDDNDHLRLTFFIEKQPYYLWTLKAMLETMAANPRSPLLPFPYNPNDGMR